jgi:hypothetical protein
LGETVDSIGWRWVLMITYSSSPQTPRFAIGVLVEIDHLFTCQLRTIHLSMQLQVDCTTGISSAFCRRNLLQAWLLQPGSRGKIVGFWWAAQGFARPWPLTRKLGIWGVYVCWGVHALASNLEAGCTSKCMHFPQIPRLACLLVLVLVTIEVEHRFGYLPS